MKNFPPSYEAYLIRHGETDWNAEGRFQGHSDIPLNAKGIAQAVSLKASLSKISFSAALSSDLSRARQTAELILQSRSLPIIESPALRERNAGALEGKKTEVLDELMRPFFSFASSANKRNLLKCRLASRTRDRFCCLPKGNRFFAPLCPSSFRSDDTRCFTWRGLAQPP